ncbi:MAG: rhomboid family intramembrane serine protease [Candidatus Electrothrix sp. AR3]|nr:rhomboid family intramembrane serine protease [Candidatus Electrothrix sp. AR3]
MKLGVATFPVYLICTIWAVFLIDFLLPLQLNAYGIIPRTSRGLIGILFTNMLHANFRHLISNTVPLFVLSLLMVLFYRKIFIESLVIIIACGGILVWIFARPANHIGASMLIYGLAAFLVSYGLMKKKIVPVVVSIVVAFVYGGGMLSGILPTQVFISWEGHLFGAVGGTIAAYRLNTSQQPP